MRAACVLPSACILASVLQLTFLLLLSWRAAAKSCSLVTCYFCWESFATAVLICKSRLKVAKESKSKVVF